METNKEMAYLLHSGDHQNRCGTRLHLALTEPDLDKLHALFTQYEFKRWISDLENGGWLAKKSTRSAPSKAAVTGAVQTPQPRRKSVVKTMKLFSMKRR